MSKLTDTQTVIASMKPPVLIEDKKTGRRKVVTINTEPTKTQQQFAAECDVNNIMKKYLQTGEIHHINRKTGVYADLSMITDYQDMLDTVLHAQSAFKELPAEVRKEFDNNPQKLIDFLGDEKNREKAIKLGLINKPEVVNQEPPKTNQTKTGDVTTPPAQTKTE